MATLDFSTNRCYPLRMPNVESSDLREKLEKRVGAATVISKSRMYVYGGCVLGMDMASDFTFNDIVPAFEKELEKLGKLDQPYVDFLSNECFTLSLIKGKWTHYKVENHRNVPTPRMFHSSAVHDNYMYIRGGVTFNENNELIMLNDFWSFDTIDKKWKCFFEDGNDKVPFRFNDMSIYVSSLSIIGHPTHNGIMSMGGVSKENIPDNRIYFFDMFSSTVTEYDGQLVNSLTGEELILSTAYDNLVSIDCEQVPDWDLLLFHKPKDIKNHQPLLIISNDLSVSGITVHPGSNIDVISNLEHPTLGKFGKNYVVTGFESGKNRLSSYVYNYSTNLWTQLQISCIHKIYAHKLSLGVVWESHHKIIFLGTSSSRTNEPQSVKFFDTMLVLALPFTNILANNVEISSKFSPRDSITMSRTSSNKSDLNTLQRQKSYIPQSNSQSPACSAQPCALPHIQTQNHHHKLHHAIINPGFEEYSNHVAQQIQISSIQSVLPPYAIAIAKGAFHKTDAFSDMAFVCADGSIVPGQLTLCRRRWGAAFDLLLTDSYAKSLAEAKIKDSNSGFYVHTEEKSSSSFDAVSNKSKGSDNSTVPHFRYPFKDSDSSSSAPNISNSAQPIVDSESSQNSSRRNSKRKMSLPYLSPNAAAHRASLSISQSRRNSNNIGSLSRNNSISFPSRRNSLNLIQQAQSSSSRRGSALSRSSIVSGTSTSSITSPNFKSNYEPVTPLTELNPTAQTSSIGSEVKPNHYGNVYVQNLPPPLPMPTVLPNGKPANEDSFDPFDGDTTLESNTAQMDFIPSTPNLNTNSDMTMGSLFNTTNGFDEENNFHFGKLPRVLYLPYSKSTVQALNEYLYSGQIGANWKIFPTVTELLLVSKKLGIPLLYDLLLEIIFVVLGLIEFEINDGLKNEGLKRGLDIETCDHGGKDDYEVYCQLLSEISNDLRRTSGSTIDSGIINGDNSELAHQEEVRSRSILEDDSLGPTDSGLNSIKNGFDENANLNSDDDDDDDDESIFGLNYFKNSLCVLDESGYYSTTEDFDEDDTTSDEDLLGGSFKKFTIGGNNSQKKHKDNDNENDVNNKRVFKEWPTVRDYLNNPFKTWLSKTILDLTIELGELVNDSHLLFRALHVRELYLKLQDLHSQHIHREEGSHVEPTVENDILGPKSPSSAVRSSVETVGKSQPHFHMSPITRPNSISELASSHSTDSAVSSKPMKGSKSSIRNVMGSFLPREKPMGEIDTNLESVGMHKSSSHTSLVQKKAKTIFGRFKRS